MTEQNARTNVNKPRGGRLLTSDTQLNLDDDLVVVDSSAGPITVTLPTAAQIPGLALDIKAPNATTNNVTIATLGVETIDGNPSATLVTDGDTIQLKSDGENWRNICCNIGAGTVTGDPILFPEEVGGPTTYNAGDPLALFGLQIEEGVTSILFASQTANVTFAGPTLIPGITPINDTVSQITDSVPANAVGEVATFVSNDGFLSQSNTGPTFIVENPVTITTITTDPITADSGTNVAFTFELSNEPFNLGITPPAFPIEGDFVALTDGAAGTITINSITSIVGNVVTLDIDTTSIATGTGTLSYTRATNNLPSPVTANFTIN